jgi:hypothetical protein
MGASVVPLAMLLVIARAISNAPSQETELCTGDHRNSRLPSAEPAAPVGSNTHVCPSRDRAGTVAWATSALVDVLTAGPACAINAGMITPLVLPDRGGPSSSTARSGRAYRAPPSRSCPRYAPPP